MTIHLGRAALADDLPKPIREELADFRASCREAGTDIAGREKAVRPTFSPR